MWPVGVAKVSGIPIGQVAHDPSIARPAVNPSRKSTGNSRRRRVKYSGHPVRRLIRREPNAKREKGKIQLIARPLQALGRPGREAGWISLL